MFKKILVATDGSPRSEKAADMAIALAKNFNAVLLVVSVVDTGSPRSAMDIDLDSFEEIKEDNAIISKQVESNRIKPEQQFISRVRSRAESDGLATEGIVRIGEVAAAILSCAEENSPDMIVVGTHGRGPIATALRGSVATKVIQGGVVPVLVVPTAD